MIQKKSIYLSRIFIEFRSIITLLKQTIDKNADPHYIEYIRGRIT